MMNRIKQLGELGQSVWYDNISRDLLVNGGLQALIDRGIVGLTSNPSIFENAISRSHDYDEALESLIQEGLDTMEIYEALAIDDIQRTSNRKDFVVVTLAF